jgi:hypothetical protein
MAALDRCGSRKRVGEDYKWGKSHRNLSVWHAGFFQYTLA